MTVVEVGKLVLEEGGDVGADLGVKSQFLNLSEACSSPSTTSSITSFPPLWRRWHMVGCVVGRAGVGFSRMSGKTAWGCLHRLCFSILPFLCNLG